VHDSRHRIRRLHIQVHYPFVRSAKRQTTSSHRDSNQVSKEVVKRSVLLSSNQAAGR
jgi:hypothetical protein